MNRPHDAIDREYVDVILGSSVDVSFSWVLQLAAYGLLAVIVGIFGVGAFTVGCWIAGGCQ